jgi:two-component system chemotaxis sensor kinase CheA
VEVSQYLDLFISEGQDHLQAMSQALLALEKKPDDLSQLEAFFRAAHTLKGMSAALGFQRTAVLSHDMEDVLDTLRHKERALTPDLSDLLFRCLDTLGALLQGIAAGEGERRDVAEMQKLLQAAREAPAVPPAPVPAAVPQTGVEVSVEIAPDCVLKGPRAFLVLKRLAAVAPVLGSDPPEAALRAGQYEQRFRVFLSPAGDAGALQKAARAVAEVVTAEVRQPHPSPPTPSPLPQGERGEGPAPAETPATTELAPAAAAPTGEAAAPVVRIKVALLDRLLETVADLVINRSHMAQIAHRAALPDLEETVETYSTALNRLQETVLAMRMIPAGQVFNRFPRMVRDLARQQGKEIDFDMEGAEIELDRTILEKITDPLVHLLRNAVDHGIESPAERQQAGKPLPAHIRLHAQRQQDKAVVSVDDDGQGMAPEKIRRVAVERGVITAEEAATLDVASSLELICRPDFSTSTAVTGVSGRGVGMGVVKQVMEEIGGALEIESHPGQGSCFRMIFPLTMAILPALLVRVHGETYALPLAHVVRSLEAPAGDVQKLHRQPVLRWEERVLPLVSLAEMLGVPRESAAEAVTLPVVVVERGRQRYGLVVDEILGKEDIVLKPLGSYLQQIEGLAGATIRGEGEVVLVLDVPGLVRRLS